MKEITKSQELDNKRQIEQSKPPCTTTTMLATVETLQSIQLILTIKQIENKPNNKIPETAQHLSAQQILLPLPTMNIRFFLCIFFMYFFFKK